MNRDKLNKAAELHSNAVFNEYPEDVTDNTLEFECNKAFRRGADWLMQQPLSERLTDEEKEKVIKKYNFYDEAGLSTAIRTGEMANKYILMRDSLEDIFGADLFKEK